LTRWTVRTVVVVALALVVVTLMAELAGDPFGR
jgi:hypothetical protein